jgi:hypothetical protein
MTTVTQPGITGEQGFDRFLAIIPLKSGKYPGNIIVRFGF